MSFRDERDRARRDYPSRSEVKSHHGRGSIPPSRHLWAGNLSHNLTESALARHFLQFGDLESIAYQPGRSYAFVNFINDEDAFAAVKELQGFVIGGNPLRIEFAKPEKSSIPPRDSDYAERRDEPYHKSRESPLSHRDSRARHSSPELLHLNKSKVNDNDAEPSEVLWVGFPAQLKIDEFILRKAFSPFGEIEKITAFPGRTYAFVRFRNVMAACRAKDTLHGKLFGNPRVHISFAKSDSGPPNRERTSTNDSPSPYGGSYGRSGSFDQFRPDRNFGGMSGDYSIRSPPFNSNMDPDDRNLMMGSSRNAKLWPSGADARSKRRFTGHGNNYEPLDSPRGNVGARIREFSPHNFPRQGPIYDDDPWDLPEDVSFFHETKKLKMNNTSPPDNELPEYPFSDLDKAKCILPQQRVVDKNYDSRDSRYRPIPKHLTNTAQQFGERGDHWNSAYDDLNPLPSLDRRRLTPERRQSSAKEVWKWEGMIAKGGTSVCRARCFPVGKPPDMVLPGYLDCTARTSLDMLAKHYYQATGAWVVFFSPANDPDISYYNEFMNYLGEKQRAAVVKLDERTTLFLVPPSEFSEKVLKVPGRLSISGVVLRLETPGSSYGRPTIHDDNRETAFASFHGDLVHQKPISPPGPYLPTLPLTNYERPNMNVAPISRSSSSYYAQNPAPGANWQQNDFPNSNPSSRNITSHSSNNMSSGYSTVHRPMQEASTHSNYTPDNFSGYPSGGNGKSPIVHESPQISSGLPPEQLAQLTSSLLGQQGQLGGASSTGEYKPSGNINQSAYPLNTSQNYGLLQNDQVSSEFTQSQFGQMQQHQPTSLASSQREVQDHGQDDTEADPQKRLKATLQLAAALLQQIQQGKGT